MRGAVGVTAGARMQVGGRLWCGVFGACVAFSCSDGNLAQRCSVSSDCKDGQVCVDAVCAETHRWARDTGPDPVLDAAPDADGTVAPDASLDAGDDSTPDVGGDDSADAEASVDRDADGDSGTTIDADADLDANADPDADGDGPPAEDAGCSGAPPDQDCDGTPDSLDDCPEDPGAIAPGICGCGRRLFAAGPSYAQAAISVAGIGTVEWSSPGNIRLADNSYVGAYFPPNIDQTSYYLLATDFRFLVASAVEVIGVAVAVLRKASSTSRIMDVEVRLRLASDVLLPTNRARGELWPAPLGEPEWAQYGGESDLWGASLAPADVNATGFGVALAVRDPSGLGTYAYVDTIRMTVHYCQ